MRYIIDSADQEEIRAALELGACGITANPSMYRKCHQELFPFLTACSGMDLAFLSGEVMEGTLEEMEAAADALHSLNPQIIVKLNLSPNALRLCSRLRKKGRRTAVTLIFTVAQAVAAINAGADYLFPFIGRSDEYGLDGLKLLGDVQGVIDRNQYPVSVVAASIKNLHQLETAALLGVGYAALPYALYVKSLEHPLTSRGAEEFQRDWNSLVGHK